MQPSKKVLESGSSNFFEFGLNQIDSVRKVKLSKGIVVLRNLSGKLPFQPFKIRNRSLVEASYCCNKVE
nr:hypothetical protein CFP56_54537 [Quercus suber]